jgi:hypothetical protein
MSNEPTPQDPKSDKSELKKLGTGQPIDEVALWAQMEEDRLDKILATHEVMCRNREQGGKPAK